MDLDWIPGADLTADEGTFVELVGILATATAAILALVAIRQAGKHGRQAMDALARERRLDFELDVLKELAGYLLLHAFQGDRDRQAVLRLSMLPTTNLGMCRARYKLDGPAAYDRLSEQVVPELGNPIDEAKMSDGRSVREHMLDEVRAAIRARLDERGL